MVKYKRFLSFILLLCFLLLTSSFLFVKTCTDFQPQFYLTRYSPDGNVNSSFLVLDYLNHENWYSIEHTNYSDNSLIHTVHIEKGKDYFSITKKDSSDYIQENLNVVKGSGISHYTNWGDIPFSMISETLSNGECLCKAEYYYDDSNRLFWIHTYIDNTDSHDFFFEYDENNHLVCQKMVLMSGETSYISYFYNESNQIIRSEQYDNDNSLVGYSTFRYDLSNTRTEDSYLSDGTKVSHCETLFDNEGNVQSVTTYDKSNNLVSQTCFNYGKKDVITRPANLAKLFMMWICIFLVSLAIVHPQKQAEEECQ